jgi:hypothetical protein
MVKAVVPDGEYATHVVDIICFPMAGQRFGVGMLFHSSLWDTGQFVPLRLDAPVASALFPGMVAAGRIYADLVVSEIEV